MDRRFLRIIIVGAAVLLGLYSLFAVRILAQSDGTPWSNLTNISKSGAASRPVMAAAPDGTLHVMWWDALEGEQYAHTKSISDTTWTQPAAISAIIGSRKVDPETGRTLLTPPRALSLVAAANGAVHAVWIDDKDQLLYAVSGGTGWGAEGTQIAEAARDFNITTDAGGALHLAYVRPQNSSDAPAGIYYRVNTGKGWSTPKLVYGSQYFRSAKTGTIYPSVTGDSAGHAIVTWSDPQTGQSTYAQTADGGTTWSAPQAITEMSAGRALQARVSSAPNGTWLMIWRDGASGGCGFLQRLSTDAGQTWGAAQKVLADITRCGESWNFMYGGDGRLWVVGNPAAPADSAAASVATIAAWDGAAWSKPVDLALSYYESETSRTITLNCVGAAVAGSTAGAVGCDSRGDIWAARSTVDLQHLVNAVKPVWDPVEVITSRASAAAPDDLPAVVTDRQGDVFAIWNQAAGTSDNETALFGAVQSNDRWSRTTLLLRSPQRTNLPRTASQPSSAIDAQDRIHVVWSGGPNGPVGYSWVFARDFSVPTAWAQPTWLPAALEASSWPDVAVDSAGERLYVIYAKPFNEQRGIYLARSLDGGTTWLTPTLVFDAAAAKWDSVDKPQIALDEQTNMLHATWLQSTLPGSTSAQAIYYARSTDQGKTWSVPLKLAEGAVDWPRLSLSATTLYVAWSQAVAQAAETPSTQYSVWGAYSSDSGEQWSPADAVSGFGQVSGPSGLHGDGTGRLYLAAIGEGMGGESILNVSQWLGQTWGAEDKLELGQPAARGNTAVISFEPAAGRLSAVMRLWILQQDNQGQFEVAATGRDVAPAVLSPPPTFTPMPSMTPEPTATPRPSPTPHPPLSSAEQRPVANTYQGPPPLVLGGVLAAIIVVVVAAGRTIRARRR